MSMQLVHSYSTALYEMGQEKNKTANFEQALASLKPVFEDPEVLDFFKSPIYSTEDKEKVINNAVEGKVDKEFLDFLKLLAKNDRLGLLPQIVENYQDCCCTGESTRKGQVVSALELSPEEQQKIKKSIEDKLGFPVTLEFSVDPSLAGGIEARVGSYLIEDSLKSGLRRLNESLKRSAH